MNKQLLKCKVCKFRQITFKHGILCGISESKAPENCDKFEFDKQEFEDIVSAQKNQYLKKLDDELAYITKKPSIRFTSQISHYEDCNFDQANPNIKVKHSKLYHFILGIACIIAPFLILKNFSFENWDYIGIGLSLLFVLGSLYSWFLVFFAKPVLVIGSKGISYKNELIEWNTIVCTSFQSERTNKESQHLNKNLVIDKLIGKVSIQVRSWNMKEEEVGHYIELFKNRYGRIN